MSWQIISKGHRKYINDDLDKIRDDYDIALLLLLVERGDLSSGQARKLLQTDVVSFRQLQNKHFEKAKLWLSEIDQITLDT